MSELPQGWISTTVGELSEVSPKNDCPDETEVGFIPMQRMGTRFLEVPEFEVRRWGSVKKGFTAFANGDVLLARITPCFENGKGGIPQGLPNGLGAGSTEHFVLRPKAQVLNAKYLLALFKTQEFLLAGRASMTGAVGQQRVPKAQVLGYRIPVAPYQEQLRIGAKIDALLSRADACRERLDRVPQILKRFREAVLEAAVSGRLTEEWRESRNLSISAESQVRKRERLRTGRLRVRTESAAIANLDLPEIPESWSWVQNHRLAEDAESAICAGPFGTIFKAKDFRPTGVPIIFLRHVAPGRYLTAKPGFMDVSVWREVHKPYSVRGGELLVTKLGDPPGTACIYPKGSAVAMVTPDVMKMSVDESIATTKYLMYFFNSPLSKRLTQQLAFGVTRLRIDLAMFKTFPIPLPTLDEQREVIRRVDELFDMAGALHAKYQVAVEQLTALTPSILAKAFRGELVPQDPNDESASEMLERVREVKGAEGKSKKGKAKTKAPGRRGKLVG